MVFGLYFYIEIADCIWESWGDWSVCSQSCGGGKRIRTRMVANHETKGGNCNGEFSEEEDCNTDICPAGINITIYNSIFYNAMLSLFNT